MKETKEKRVINIPKEDFELIKNYCDEHSLNVVKWIVNNSKSKIPLTKDNSHMFTLDEILSNIMSESDTVFVAVCALIDKYGGLVDIRKGDKYRKGSNERIKCLEKAKCFLGELGKILQLSESMLDSINEHDYKLD